MQIYRTEHPNPQWERKHWKNLNGEWEFDFDFGKSAKERELWKAESLPQTINVPFCPESILSGIGYTDFIPALCYRKSVVLSEEECRERVILHFGAVDYESFLYVNGKKAFHHIGGYSSFAADITSFVHAGENVIFLIAEDDTRGGKQAVGKQSMRFASYSACYTRTTGIWQTVWLEFVPKQSIESAKYYPDIDNSCLTITGRVCGKGVLTATAFFDGKEQGKASVSVNHASFSLRLPLAELHLWELGKGNLYDLELRFQEDTVKSYFGMRQVSLDGKKFILNGKSVFQRTVLDQGYYKEGIYTAKSEEELKQDILLSLEAGFNGARLHQKIFEPRFLYHCDKLGYMVWAEHANWGVDCTDAVSVESFTCEWLEAVERDFNHPSVIGWCPFNETWGYIETQLPHRTIEMIYRLTKNADPTRPCIDTSGNYHIKDIDIYDVHNYDDNPESFREAYAHIKEGILTDTNIKRDMEWVEGYRGEAVFVSEYGGILWKSDDEKNEGWGYGNAPKTEEEFFARYKELTDALLDNPDIMGFCYTQLYDVEQEMNGLYTYEREPKFDVKVFRNINQRKAEIEK